MTPQNRFQRHSNCLRSSVVQRFDQLQATFDTFWQIDLETGPTGPGPPNLAKKATLFLQFDTGLQSGTTVAKNQDMGVLRQGLDCAGRTVVGELETTKPRKGFASTTLIHGVVTAAIHMTMANKIFGMILFGVAIPLAVHVDAHGILYGLLANAATIFILFAIQLPKARCRQCGHYSKMNIWDKYVMGRHPALCNVCRTNPDTVISTSSPDPERIITLETSDQNRECADNTNQIKD